MKKIISVILCIAIMFGCMSSLNLSVSATSAEERDVHYSDLFYGYFHYLENSPLLQQYYEGTSGTLGRIYTDFYNDGEYVWSGIKTFVDLMGSPATAVAIIAEKAGLGNYTYNNMLDSANVIFAKHLANASEGNELAPTFNKYYTAFKDATNVIADISHDLAAIPEDSDNYATSVVDAVINAFKEERLLSRIPNTELMKTNQKLVNSMGEIVSAAGEITSVIDAATVYATALSLENVRADIVSDIYANAPAKSMLKDGMSRLYSDLTNQFSTYFIDNYIVDKVLLDFADEMSGKIGGGAAAIISGVAKVLSFVSFEILRPETVSFDDLMTQVALKNYVDNAYSALISQNSIFSSPFKAENVNAYLNTLQGLVCAVDAATDATEKIVLSYNKAELETIKRNFYGKDMRAVILNQAVATVKTTPKNELIKTSYGSWKLTDSDYSSSYPVKLRSGSDTLESYSIYTPWDGLNANITITNHISVEVPEGEKPILNGYLKCERTRYLGTGAKITNYGDLTINGYFSASSSNSAAYGSMYNYGTFRVSGNIGLGYHGNYIAYDGSVTSVGNEMSIDCSFNKGSTLYYGKSLTQTGNFAKSFNGHIILNGTSKQTLKNVNWTKITIENTSAEGVELYKVNVNEYFNHNGKPFTATNCTFTDYDGDGVKDDKDTTPIVGNPCVITITTNGSEKGSVSAEKLETYGGAEHTVTATPSPKYEFVQWKNAAGQVLTSNASYTFVAKGDSTLQAVFRKRSQPITVSVSGGSVSVPTSAEIDSEVSVSFTLNEGYIYTEGSLSYNGIPIENNKFIMPDEAVTITAEFIRNEHYFALKEKLAEVKKYTYEEYSASSFADLQYAIMNAESVLDTAISEEVACENIIALQNAQNALTGRYPIEMRVDGVPELFLGCENDIYMSYVLIMYDNSTEEYTYSYTVDNFDCNIYGLQEVIFRCGELQCPYTVFVEKRPMFYVEAEKIPDQLFVDENTYLEPELNLTFYPTGEKLVLGEDYDVTYSNNNAIGIAIATATGKGIYGGSFDFEFKIYCDHSKDYENGICSVCGIYEEPVKNSNGYYELKNAGNLFWFSETVNSGNNTINGILTADIDLDGLLWTPIGVHNDFDSSVASINFKGIFDGNYHVVKNMTVSASNANEAGFFGRTYGAKIHNLGIENASVNQSNENRVRAGILGGEIYNSTVSNCYALGTVTTLHDQSGGIAGEAAGGTAITNCYTNFSVLVGGPCTITNSYDSTSATEEQFKNGQICEFLNNGSENIWGQTVGIDKFPVFAQNATVLGDIDGDKILSAIDLVFFKKSFMNDVLDSYTGTGADINIDGKIDILDLVCMKNRLLSAE